MSKVLELINNDKNFIITLEVPKNEIGNKLNIFDKIYLFSENALNIHSKVVRRGKNEVTQYIFIPQELRIKNPTKTKKALIGKINDNTYVVRF